MPFGQFYSLESFYTVSEILSRLRSYPAQMVLVQLKQLATSRTATQVIPCEKYEWLRDSKSIIWHWIFHLENLLRFLLPASISGIGPESLPDSRFQTSRTGVNIFPVSAYQEKVRITNNNNELMIIQFVKDEGLPVVCVATRTCLYHTERGSRAKHFVSYGFVCCQENESYLTPVFPKGRFPLGRVFRAERHFPLENVMRMRSSLLLCVKFPQKNSSRRRQKVENCVTFQRCRTAEKI